MQHGDERKKRQKYGGDIIYHVGCFWYGLYKVELIPYDRMNGISSHSLRLRLLSLNMEYIGKCMVIERS